MNMQVSEAFLDRWVALAKQALPVFEERVLEVAPAERAEVYGGKLTGLLPELVALSRIPGLSTRFLILERDPRDIFASALKRYGETPEGPYLAFMNASLSLDYAAAHLPNAMRIHYARLVARPDETIGEILDFIGVERRAYDWPSIQSDLISNSSFIGIGPNDLLQGAGIRPSIGKHTALDPYHRAAFAEFFGLGPRPTLRTRIRLHEEFLPQTISLAQRYGYAMHGLTARAKQRRGMVIPMALSADHLLKRGKFPRS